MSESSKTFAGQQTLVDEVVGERQSRSDIFSINFCISLSFRSWKLFSWFIFNRTRPCVLMSISGGCTSAFSNGYLQTVGVSRELGLRNDALKDVMNRQLPHHVLTG